MIAARLVQPDAHGRLSGGYLYNAKMAEHGAWEIAPVSPDTLPREVEHWDVSRLTLLDSLYLTERGIEPFLRLRERGGELGVVLHSFPSMIAAAERGEEPRTYPSSFEVAALERMGVVLVPGRHYSDLLRETTIRFQITEPGIDPAWRRPPRPRRGRCRLISVGAVTPRKGFLDVARALLRRAADDFQWTVIGSVDVDPSYAARVADCTRELPSVELTGQLPPEEVRRRVLDSDILVMPSYDENQPLVLLEAMAASLPAVAYAAGATRHMLTHGTEGLIAPIGDVELLFRHLTRLLDDEPARQRMSIACWARQRSLPSWPEAASHAARALHAR